MPFRHASQAMLQVHVPKSFHVYPEPQTDHVNSPSLSSRASSRR